jgi:hypothetical protein
MDSRAHFFDYDYYYSCSASANVKNMLKSSLDLWNTGLAWNLDEQK